SPDAPPRQVALPSPGAGEYRSSLRERIADERGRGAPRVVGVIVKLFDLALIGFLVLSGCRPPSHRAPALELRLGEWPTYGGSYDNTRYDPLDQITRDTGRQLSVAWRGPTPGHRVM